MKKISLYILLFSLSFWSCKKEQMGDCFKPNGKEEVEARYISSFSHIELRDRINLNYHYSPNYSIKVSAGKNLMDGITTKVTDGKLLIENTNRCNWVRSFKKEITVSVFAPEFSDFTYRGSGEVNFIDTLKTNQFKLNLWDASGNMHLKFLADYVSLKSHTAAGSIYAVGKCRELIAYLGGNGRIETPNLESQKALAINKNTGKLFINCQSEMKAEIKGPGDIEYIGSPIVDFSREGSGRLIKRD